MTIYFAKKFNIKISLKPVFPYKQGFGFPQRGNKLCNKFSLRTIINSSKASGTHLNQFNFCETKRAGNMGQLSEDLTTNKTKLTE